MATERRTNKQTEALSKFREAGGILRTRDALNASIHPRTLYALRDSGQIEELSRGVFRLADAPPLGEPDLITVAMRVPRGVICLISALAWHELTTQIPHEIHIALPRGSQPPRIDFPPVRHYSFGQTAFTEGVETHVRDGVTLRIYGREKTLADCFKYRNRLGLDVALEALKTYLQQGNIDLSALLHYATVCRVNRVITPYVESLM